MAGLFGLDLFPSAQTQPSGGLFGGNDVSAPNRWLQALSLLGATLTDVGNNGRSDALSRTQASMKALADQAQKDAIAKRLGDAFTQPNQVAVTPAVNDMSAQAPQLRTQAEATNAQPFATPSAQDLAPVLAQGIGAGVDPTPYLNLQKLESKQNVRILTPDEMKSYGFRPGSVGIMDEDGVPKVLQSSDVKSQDAIRQEMDLKNAVSPAEQARINEQIRHDKATEAANNPFGNLPGASAANPSGAHGQDFLTTLPNNVALQVKALAEGRMAFPSGYALKSPYWQTMLQAVSQYDPSFDAVNYNARSKTRNDFTSGKSAQNITALNTAIGHLDSLDKSISTLDNGNIPMINRVSNFVATETGDPRIKDFNTTKKAVVDELTRVFRGTGGSEQDIKTWSENLDDASSPAQLHGVVNKMVDLLKSRIDAVGDTYNRGMGTTADPLNLLSPKAAAAIKRLSGDSAASGSHPQDIQTLLQKYGVQ